MEVSTIITGIFVVVGSLIIFIQSKCLWNGGKL